MNITKNDLSGDSTKLDFEALVRVAGIAYSNARQLVERDLGDLQHLLGDGDYLNAHFPSTSKILAENAERMALAADVYHTLLNARSRSQISIVNKPVLKEEVAR